MYKLFASLLFTIVLSHQAIAMEQIDEEKGEHSEEEEVANDENNDWPRLRALWKCATDGCYAVWDAMQDGLDALGTAKGATVVACTYGIAQGISNFLWAFNWEDHAGASETAAKIIQEIGGLSASAECFIIGAMVPVMLYKYNKHVEREKARAAPAAIED